MPPLQKALVERTDDEIAGDRDPQAEDPTGAALALDLATRIAKDLHHVRTELTAEGAWIEDEEVWLPELAKILGAPPPQHYPRLLARLFAGEAPVIMATESCGASNAKAKRELGWTLRYPSWRQRFAAAYGQTRPLKANQPTPLKATR